MHGKESYTNLGRKYLKKIHNLEDTHSDKIQNNNVLQKNGVGLCGLDCMAQGVGQKKV